MSKGFHFPKIGFSRLFPNVIGLALGASAALVLGWVGWLTWVDMAEWGKDIGSIFFGSRANEPISLGIGMTLIHYLLVGLSLLAAGAALTLRRRILATKPQRTVLMELQKLNTQNSEDMSEVKSLLVNEENAAAEEKVIFLGCHYHFGYLSSRPDDSAIPQECMLCPRLGDCMVATVYVKKLDE